MVAMRAETLTLVLLQAAAAVAAWRAWQTHNGRQQELLQVITYALVLCEYDEARDASCATLFCV